jgi:hypothetical protein
LIINSLSFQQILTINSPNGQTAICNGSPITLTSSVSVGNQWFRNGVLIPGANLANYSATSAGTYYSVAGPDTSNRITLTSGLKPATPVVNLSGSTVLCSNNAVSISTNLPSGTSVIWSSNGQQISTSTTSGILPISSAGNYYAVISLNGCLSDTSNSFNFSQGVTPVASFSVNDTTDCLIGNRFTFSNRSTISSGSTTSNWDFGNGSFSTANNVVKSYSNSGNYLVRLISSSNSGCKDTVYKTVRVIAHDTARIQTTGNSTICFGDSTRLSTSSNFGIRWVYNGITISGSTTSTYFASIAGGYTLIVSMNGCSDTSAVTNITVNPKPAVPTITPNGGQLVSSSAAGNQWNFNGSPISGASLPSFSPTQSGNYSVTVTNGFGCSSTSANTFIQLSTLPVISNTTSLTFCQGGGVTLTSSVVQGNQWFRNGSVINGANSNTYLATIGGSYFSVVGNDTSNTIQVVVNPLPIARFGIANAIQCQRGNQFSILDSASITSGALTYFYDFANGFSSSSPSSGGKGCIPWRTSKPMRLSPSTRAWCSTTATSTSA